MSVMDDFVTQAFGPNVNDRGGVVGIGVWV